MRRAWIVVGLVCMPGCLGTEGEKTSLVNGNLFGAPPRLGGVTQVNYPKGDPQLGQRVAVAGQKLVDANPQLGFRPLFATIGSPQLEIFHADAPAPFLKEANARSAPLMIYITEGMVRRCPSEIELSALLSFELARVLADREASVNPDIRNPERAPPITVPIGNAGQTGGLDFTNTAELAKFEAKYPKTARPTAPPDPRKLALALLDKAGYPPNALDVVDPLLREADNNAALERHLKGGGATTWRPE